MEDNKNILLSTVAIIIAIGAVGYFAFRGKSKNNNSVNGIATTSTGIAPISAPITTLMGDTTNPMIIAGINSRQIPPPPEATGWYWNGSQWYPSTTTPITTQYIPTNNGSHAMNWLFKSPLTISGNNSQGVPVTHLYNKGDVVRAVYDAGYSAGSSTSAVKLPTLTWSDTYGNFVLAGDDSIHSYLMPPLV